MVIAALNQRVSFKALFVITAIDSVVVLVTSASASSLLEPPLGPLELKHVGAIPLVYRANLMTNFVAVVM